MTSLIRQMGYVVIETPNPQESARDLRDIVGVRITTEDAELSCLSSNARAVEVAYRKGPAARVAAVGLEATDAAAVDEVLARAVADGMDVLDDHPSLPGIDRAVRFVTPFGQIFEVHTPAHRDHGYRRRHPAAHATRLDHVNLRSPDTRGFHDLLTGMLGMKLSDRTEDFSRAWYRAGDGFHHTLACAEGSGMHHFGFDVHSVQDLVGVADSLVLKDRSLLWGLGRHGPGNNIFSYYLDPNGCVVENSFGMERIDIDALREPGVWSANYADRVLDLWGSRPPPAYPGALTPFAL